MKKLFLSILSVAIIAGSLFAFTGCNGKDYTSDIDDLKSQIQELEDKSAKIAELEAELAKLKNENASLEAGNTDLQTKINSLQNEINKLKNETDLFTGSPKFNYSINETIPYYVNGTKIFDFKITKFEYSTEPGGDTRAYYTVNFTPNFNVSPETVFAATAYNPTEKKFLEMANHGTGFYNTTIAYYDQTGSQVTLTLYYLNYPFACITAKPTLKK